MRYLVGIIVTLVGYILYKNSKFNSAEGLLDNLKTKEILLGKDEQKTYNDAQIKEAEDAISKQKDQLGKDRKDMTDEEFSNFLNNYFNK